MLSLHSQEGKLRAADNLLPRADGSLCTRPGAVQIFDGSVDLALPWGNSVLLQSRGRLWLVANGTVQDFGVQGRTLSVAPYQALIADGKRENRLYVADGVNPLWYIRRNGATYERVDVINLVTDDSGVPFPLPIPKILCNWSNRLWIGDGTNRIQHCQNERPEEWDPLWVLEFQGDTQAAVVAMMPHAGNLMVALENSLWQVAGTSQYNWTVQEALHGFGVIGAQAMVSDGNTLATISRHGVHLNGAAQSVADDLRELFLVPQIGAQVVIDPKRRLLLLSLAGRVFVMHLDNPGQFSEISRIGIRGVVALYDDWGFYDIEGLWLIGRLNIGDQASNGTQTPITTRYDTWEAQPNVNNSGRALLDRLRLGIAGIPGKTAHYQATVDDTMVFWADISLSNEDPALWGQVPYADSQKWPPRMVWRELSPKLAGTFFRHTLVCSDYIEIKSFLPEYRFGLPVKGIPA